MLTKFLLTRASQYFFSGEHSNDLTTVQYVYLAVALMGVAVATAFVFTPLPEVSEAALQAEAEALADANEAEVVDRGFWRTRAPFGFVTQFMYVGAQVTIGTFFINYCHENGGIQTAQASQFLSYALILFTVGRFVGTALLSVISAPLLLSIYAVMCCVLVALISTLKGMGGVGCIMAIMFFESIMWVPLHTSRDVTLIGAFPTGTPSFSSLVRPDWVDTRDEALVCWSWVSFAVFEDFSTVC